MEQFDIYKDIKERTGGDIYIGVVGPVRTGKSTFIKRFMDLIVIPNIENVHTKTRAKDELPQSASGRIIMTTEPKFVPNEAVKISLDNIDLNVRMIDCVGYMVPGAEGELDGEGLRMVSTPWSSEDMPFREAAELGTRKVINDHSTIGVVITTDGSITDIPRESYINAEERVINELKEIDKPFIVLLNTTSPYSKSSEELSSELSNKYGVPVTPVNCAQLKLEDINNIMEKALYEFPIREVLFYMPKWIETLGLDHWLKKALISSIQLAIDNLSHIREVEPMIEALSESDFIKKIYLDKILLGEGSVKVEVSMADSLFYEILSEFTEMEIVDDYQLISIIKKLSQTQKEYNLLETALMDVKRKGYGIVTPAFEDIKLDRPEIFKQGSRYGIRLKAKGDAIHMIKTDIATEVSPIVGNEEQSKEFIDNLIVEYENAPEAIWDLNIFGRTLKTLVDEGIRSKIYHMPEDAQMKLSETLQKIVNEGKGGLICIIL